MNIENLFSLKFLTEIEQTDFLNDIKENTGQMWFEVFTSLIYTLQNTPKTNDKKSILRGYSECTEWKKFLQFVYDEVNFSYYIKELPKDIIFDNSNYNYDIDTFFKLFKELATGNYRGKASVTLFQKYLDGAPEELQQLASYILKRDISAKIGATIMNEIYNDIIFIAPYQRCEKEEKFSKRITYPCLCQTKEDGLFLNNSINVTLSNIDPSYSIYKKNVATTRYGRLIPDCALFEYMSHVKPFTFNFTVHGEGLVKKPDGSFYDRKTGNGFINSFIMREETYKAKIAEINEAKTQAAANKLRTKLENDIKEWQYTNDNLTFRIWDIVPTEDWLKQESEHDVDKRFNWTKLYVNAFNEYIESNNIITGPGTVELIDYIYAANEDEVNEYYQNKLDLGLEGIVAKNLHIGWNHDVNSKGIIKFKDFMECDLLVTGWIPGEGEFTGGIGSLISESSDKLLMVNISGMKRHMRGLERVDEKDSSKGLKVIDGFDFDHYTGKIITVKFNEVIDNKANPKIKSLFIPNIIDVREPFDKPVADDLKTILSQKRK